MCVYPYVLWYSGTVFKGEIISREITENFESLSMNDAGNLHSRPSTEEIFIRVSGAPRAVGIMVFGKFS
jgi:hypothetical protein